MIPRFSRLAHSSARGLTLMELLVSVIILAAVIVGVVMLMDQAASGTKTTVTAQYIKSFGDATNAYLRDNYATLSTSATETTPVVVKVSDLSANYMKGARATTPDGQNICALVFKRGDRLEALLVTEGGAALDDLTLGGIVSQVGGAGGALYQKVPGKIKGAMGGWELDATAYSGKAPTKCDGTTGTVTLAAGHPTMALWFQDMASGTAAAAVGGVDDAAPPEPPPPAEVSVDTFTIINSASVSTPSGQGRSATASCPAGKKILTGSCTVSPAAGPANTFIYRNAPAALPAQGWVCSLWNNSAAPNGIMARAVCL